MIKGNNEFVELLDEINTESAIAILKENPVQSNQKVVTVVSKGSNIRLKKTEEKYEIGTNGEPTLVHRTILDFQAISEESPDEPIQRKQIGYSNDYNNDSIVASRLYIGILLVESIVMVLAHT